MALHACAVQKTEARGWSWWLPGRSTEKRAGQQWRPSQRFSSIASVRQAVVRCNLGRHIFDLQRPFFFTSGLKQQVSRTRSHPSPLFGSQYSKLKGLLPTLDAGGTGSHMLLTMGMVTSRYRTVPLSSNFEDQYPGVGERSTSHELQLLNCKWRENRDP
jgi:hypothetical protein